MKKHNPFQRIQARDRHHAGLPVLEVSHLNLKYGNRFVLEDVTFTLERGQRIAVVGPNGAGKSTLFKVIAGVIPPTSGNVTVYGEGPGGHICIAYVPQRSQVDWHFPVSIYDVVMMGRYPYIPRFGRPSARDTDIVAAVMESADVAGMSERRVTELSGGERQRVVFARALAQDTPVLILDEATSNLDIGHAMRLLDLAAHRVGRASGTVLAVFQDINQAAAYCDHLIFMSQGRIAAHGGTREVLTPATIREIFEVNARVYHDDYSQALHVVYRRHGV